MKVNLKQIGVIGKIKEITVENMKNSLGNTVPNQFQVFIHSEEGVYRCLFSYESLIVVIMNGELTKVGKNYCYSNTTGKYRNMFTGLTLKKLNEYIKENMSYNCDSECWELKNE